METTLQEQFEKMIEQLFPVSIGLNGIGWHQISQDERDEFIQTMERAYNLGRESNCIKPEQTDEPIGSITSDLVGKYSVEEAIYDYWTGTNKPTYHGLIKAVYNITPSNQPAESYSKSEVEALIKKVLEDAAERAIIKNDGCDNFWLNKESITNINLDKYLTK